MKLPDWAVSNADLKKWAKVQGLFLMSECQAQVLFADAGQPIGIMLNRPLRLERSGKTILGVFRLDDGVSKRQIALCRYSPHLKAFVLKVNSEQLSFALKNPHLVRYVEGQDRDKLEEGLQYHLENEHWPLAERNGQLEPTTFEQIFKRVRVKAKKEAIFRLPV